MLRKLEYFLLGASCLLLLCGLPMQDAGAVSEYSWDNHTIILDHFNLGTTADKVEFTDRISFHNSLPGLNYALDLGPNTRLTYNFTGWSSNQGTIEFWMYPTSNKGAYWLSLDWYPYWPSGGGDIGEVIRTIDGKLAAYTWINGPYIESPHSLPVNNWSHVTFFWGPKGSGLCINDQLEIWVNSNYQPSFNSTNYLYLNKMLVSDIGYIDELRVSDIVRVNFNFAPIPGNFLLLGSGLALMLLGRRSKG
jgi:hypothetical protein